MARRVSIIKILSTLLLFAFAFMVTLFSVEFSFDKAYGTGSTDAMWDVVYDGDSDTYAISGFSAEYLTSLTNEEKQDIAIVIPSTYDSKPVTLIKADAFSVQASKNIGYTFTSLVVAEGIVTIEDSAFEGSSIKGAVTIPSTVTALGNNSFKDTASITTLYLSGGDISFLGNEVFYNTTYPVVASNEADYDAYALGITLDTLSYQTTITLNADSGEIGFGTGIKTETHTKLVNFPLSYTLTNDEWLDSGFIIPECNLTDCVFKGFATIDSEMVSASTIVTNSAEYTAVYEIPQLSYEVNTTSDGYTITGFNQAYIDELTNTQKSNISVEIGSEITLNGFTKDITAVGIDAFSVSKEGYENYKIVSLTLGGKISSIEEKAFYSVLNLSSQLIIPSSVTSISVSAFSLCEFNGGLDLSGATSLRQIGERAFGGTVISGTIVIPASVQTIGDWGFYQISATELGFADSSALTSIGVQAFSASSISGTLLLPSSLQTIGEGAFSNCSSLTGTLDIPKSVQSIGISAFASCSKITGLDFYSDSVLATIGRRAFELCTSLTGVITIPESVASIGSYAFNSCNKLSTVYLNSCTTAFDMTDSVFTNYYPVIAPSKEVYDEVKDYLPSTATYIVTVTFATESGSVESPSSQTKLYGLAFCLVMDASGIWAIDSDYSFPTASSTAGIFGGYKDSNGDVISVTTKVQEEVYTAYFKESPIFEYTYNIFNEEYSIESLNEEFLSGLTSRTMIDLVIPETYDGDYGIWPVTHVLENAFDYRNNDYTFLSFASVAIGSNVKDIGEYAFYNAPIYGELKFASSSAITAIGEYAFSEVKGFIGDLSLPNTIAKIGNNAFDSITFDLVTLPNNISEDITIGTNVFGEYKGLIIAQQESIYDKYKATVTNSGLTYELYVTFSAGTNGAVVGNVDSMGMQVKLYNVLLSYEKDENGRWYNNENYTTPKAELTDALFNRFLDSDKKEVTKNTIVSDSNLLYSAEYIYAPSVTSTNPITTIYTGDSHEIYLGLDHTLSLSYQWYKTSVTDENRISGATERRLAVTNVADSGMYYCVVTFHGDINDVIISTYSISVSIAKIKVTVTADNQQSSEGDALVGLTYTTNIELLSQDSITGNLSTTALGNRAGYYDILQGSLTSSNYDITFVSGVYTVLAKVLDYTAVDEAPTAQVIMPDGVDPSAYIVVSNIEQSDYNFTGYKTTYISFAFSVSLVTEKGYSVTRKSEEDIMIRVIMPTYFEYSGNVYIVANIDGEIVKLECMHDGQYITFTTPAFGEFAVIREEVLDMTAIIIILVIANIIALVMLGLVFIVRKKYKSIMDGAYDIEYEVLEDDSEYEQEQGQEFVAGVETDIDIKKVLPPQAKKLPPTKSKNEQVVNPFEDEGDY